MRTYNQKTGELYLDGEYEGLGYSGHGEGRNNPDAQALHGIGPIPRGLWRIGAAYSHPQLGPICMNLYPRAGTDTFGRDLFRIHGNNTINDASHGCIILGPAIRREIDAGTDRALEVVV